MYKTEDFNFHLPKDLIANKPANPRDSAKMLVFNQNQQIFDKNVADLTSYLNSGDVMVFNDTKVMKAKLVGKRVRVEGKEEARVEINLHKKLSDNVWQVFARPAKRLKEGDTLTISDDFFAEILKRHNGGLVDLKFNTANEDFYLKLEKYGQTPLPPYIKREKQDVADSVNYQTIYAKDYGAVAAPTAGLHFTKELFKKIEEKGVSKAFVTLNVGPGTFLPVKSTYIKDHNIHSEYFQIDQRNCDLINSAKKSGNKVIAVGTTSLRVLESVVDENSFLKPFIGDTDIFIYPPYKFKAVDVLMTNFHLPKSTLFMLISAFVGKNSAHKLYNHAINNKYRFYSYGDSCLLTNA